MVSKNSCLTMESPSVSIMEASSSSSKFAPISFNHSIYNNNFPLWGNQVFSSIHGHKLQSYIFESRPIPTKILKPSNKELEKINSEYVDLEQ